MPRAIFRSLIFNALFYSVTLIACIAFLPALLLPRSGFMFVVYLWLTIVYALERFVLGLNYEARGTEHLPDSGAYIIAAKHQSAYETFKLHLLFQDPAIILKKELLRIPFWGWYLKKADVIAIDRSSPKSAQSSMIEGAQRVTAQNRPIIIFPQGTRVRVDDTPEDKPYKAGLARIQDAANLPVIPMALNSGLFWPRSGFFKSPGTVIFEFMPPIAPGQDKKELMQSLERQIENKSQDLMQEAIEHRKKPSMLKLALGLILCAGLFAGYSYAWFQTADQVKAAYINAAQEMKGITRSNSTPKVSGYPLQMHLHVGRDSFKAKEGSVSIQDIHAKGWPLPGMPITIETGEMEISYFRWQEPLRFESLNGVFSYVPDVLSLHSSTLKEQDFALGIEGSVDFAQRPVPKFDLVLNIKNHEIFIQALTENKMIDSSAALFVNLALTSFSDNSVTQVPIVQKGQDLYIGPLKLISLPN